ncbi:unannotated protein [freshwater metagenome]|uniref:Unannotated protein n=1 Tax=freshwater metagenome TaxID=449393 RepID=A0A6J7XR99_9ZZZZ|nr:acyltransferase family protein [Actinomycetota bacterium]
MSEKKGLGYIPAVDGLRAFAVIAVLLYHLGFSWIPGGFLGVDLFFVISGYVITRLILDSIQRSDGLDLRAFYFARVKRLWPPLIFMIIVTVLFVGIWAPDTIKRLLTDAPFSILGAINWWLVNRHQDYFEAIGRPPLLQHTWSLAVEVQFYLIWPLILLLILKLFGKRIIPLASLLIAATSGVALLLLSFQLDSQGESGVSHIYFGTDTHSIGLFLGAALAVSWIPQNFELQVNKRAQDFIDGVGVFGFVGMLVLFIYMDENNPTIYRLAFPLAGLFGCAILMSVVHPASRFAPFLTSRLMLWIGERSYAIYLWHWIVFQVTRPSVDLAGAEWALIALRILIVFGLSEISLRFVELPIRSGQVGNWFRGLKYQLPRQRRRNKLIVIGSVCALLISTTLISAHAISISEKNIAEIKKELTSTDVVITTVEDPTQGLWVAGDSVILGIRHELGNRMDIGLINARVGRQARELIEVLRADKIRMKDAAIIFDLGNNNRLQESEVVDIFEIIKDQKQIIVVNTAVPRGWRDENNDLINRISQNYANVRIVDWKSISQDHPEYFGPDGVHLVPAGILVYVDAIISELK